MEDELKEKFHFLFNKINNICVAAEANKKILQEENPDKLSIAQILQAFERIEDNARSLDESLKSLYKLFFPPS